MIEMIFPEHLRFEDYTVETRPRIKGIDPFFFWVSDAGLAQVCEIPSGFFSDCASIPVAFWRFFPPFGPWNRAAYVHDYLCVHREKAAEMLGWHRPISSKDAAEWFYAGLKACGTVPKWKAWSMYKAVLWFGPKWGKK